MIDLKIDENYEVVIDHRKDLGTVEGRDEFEQHIALGLSEFFLDEIGSTDVPNAAARLELYAGRLVNTSERVGEVASVTVEESDTKTNTLEVSIVYRGGQTFAFDVN